jgi:hypothetical protein
MPLSLFSSFFFFSFHADRWTPLSVSSSSSNRPSLSGTRNRPRSPLPPRSPGHNHPCIIPLPFPNSSSLFSPLLSLSMLPPDQSISRRNSGLPPQIIADSGAIDHSRALPLVPLSLSRSGEFSDTPGLLDFAGNRTPVHHRRRAALQSPSRLETRHHRRPLLHLVRPSSIAKGLRNALAVDNRTAAAAVNLFRRQFQSTPVSPGLFF